MLKESWDARIRRAEQLAGRNEAARELLTFYGALLRAQKEGYEYLRGRRGWLPSGALEEDLPSVRATVPGLLRAVEAWEREQDVRERAGGAGPSELPKR